MQPVQCMQLEDGAQGQLGQRLVPDPILKTSQV
jgi:hypothetical protein